MAAGKYVIHIIFAFDIAMLFWNFIVAFIGALFILMLLMSAGGYGSPEGKWQAYTTGTGNWRIGGVAARSKDYEATRVAESKETRKLGTGAMMYVVIAIIIIISMVGMALGHGSLLDF